MFPFIKDMNINIFSSGPHNLIFSNCLQNKISIKLPVNRLGAVIEIRNLTTCAMLVINCVQADANEPFAFLVAH